jgi:hypothetical protein
VDNEVRQSLAGGPAGAYTVVWRVTSADGHPVSGTFAFTADEASTSPTTTSAPTVTAATSTTATNVGPAAEAASGFPLLAVGATAAVVALGALVVGWTVRRRRGGS